MTVRCRVFLALSVLLVARPSSEASLDGDARASVSSSVTSNPAAPRDTASAGKQPGGSDLEEALDKLASGKIGGGGGGGPGVVPQSSARRAAASASTWIDSLSPAAEKEEEDAAASDADDRDLDAAELGYNVALLAELGRLAAPDGSPGGVDADLDELDDDAELLDEFERIEAVLDRVRDSQPAVAAASAEEAEETEEEDRERAAAYHRARGGDGGEADYDSSSLPAEVAGPAGGRAGTREDELHSLLERLAAAASDSEAPEPTPEPARNLGFGTRGHYDERRMFTNGGGRGKKEEPATFASGNAAKAPEPVTSDVAADVLDDVSDSFGGLRDAALRRLTHVSRQLAVKYVAERLKTRKLLAILNAIAPLPTQSRRWPSPTRQRGYQ